MIIKLYSLTMMLGIIALMAYSISQITKNNKNLKATKALSLRILLSVMLLFGLVVSYFLNLIQPHGLL